MTKDIVQQGFSFLIESKSAAPKESAPSKKSFTPGTLENGLDPAMVQDHGMLWLRMNTKKSRQNGEKFLKHQVREMKYKRTEHDGVALIRDSLLDT